MKEYIALWKRGLDFQGKSTKREFWIVFLINFLIGAIAGAITKAVPVVATIMYVYQLVVFVPALALAIRRLHDGNRSGWNLLWILFPVIGWIILLVQLATDK